MLRIGLTGGIGSGKTTIANIFIAVGVPVYFADDRAKWLMNNSTEIRDKLICLFGKNSYNTEGLDRRFLANEVFSDKNKLEKLNAVVHPVVAQDFEEWCLESHSPVVLKEAALIFENNSQKHLDYTIVVTAMLDQRVKRVLNRDSFRTEEEVLSIIDSQLPQEEKVAKADFVVTNNADDKVLPQVLEIKTKLASFCR